MFDYLNGCHVPPNGQEGGWDIIYNIPNGYEISSGDVIHKIYVEMKNKHNTMNSASSSKTYIKMQNQLLQDDDCACFLVEAIAKRSQNIIWQTTVDKKKVSHKHIRRVSIDQFYSIVTNEEDAFYKICMALPDVISEVLGESSFTIGRPQDSVYTELKAKADSMKLSSTDMSMALAMYMLGFSTYQGFNHK